MPRTRSDTAASAVPRRSAAPAGAPATAAPPRARRRPIGADGWAGIAVLVMSIGVASPMLLGLVDARVPYGWWVALFVVFLGAMLATAMIRDGRARVLVYALAMVASWAVVLTAASGGFVLVLLVIVAALGAYVAPLWAALTVVGLNTVVVAIASFAARSDGVETAIQTGFYLLIQLATLGSSLALLQERETRRRLTAAHIELRAATLERSEAARTAERLRISRDLHDAIGHQLTVLTLQLETARHLDGVAAREHLERADAVARSLLGDVRETVGRLRVEAPDLEEALREMTADLPGLDVTIAVAPALAVDDVARAALVRAAQEVVTNTIRHSEAGTLHISVETDEGGIVLTGRDDGMGAARPRLGNGLRGLRERFAELGGEVVVDGSDGFAVRARVPSA